MGQKQLFSSHPGYKVFTNDAAVLNLLHTLDIVPKINKNAVTVECNYCTVT